MKILFLDHDGVMCLAKQFGGRFKKRKQYYRKFKIVPDSEMPVEYRFDSFDKKAVEILNHVLEQTGAEIVVTSDWRSYATLQEMGDLYERCGVSKRPVDYTPNMKDFDAIGAGLYAWKDWPSRIRCTEIWEWLKNHPETTNWVAVDDLDLGAEGLEHFVYTRKVTEGIKQSSIKEKIIDYLNK